MKDETIAAVRLALLRSPARERLITLSNQTLREVAKQIIEALESTDEMKALRTAESRLRELREAAHGAILVLAHANVYSAPGLYDDEYDAIDAALAKSDEP